MATRDQVLKVLRKVRGPDLESDIVSLGLVSEIFLSDGRVAFSITVPPERAQALEPMRQAAEKVVADLPGVERAMVALTAEASPGASRVPPASIGSSTEPPPIGQKRKPPPGRAPSATNRRIAVPGVKSIVAVASGKGGVGKSTTAVNLALALSSFGHAVGLLDADVYGPSIPRLMGLTGRPRQTGKGAMLPLRGHGIETMSIGYLVDEDTPMVWRGPMVVSALRQMLHEVAWSDLDILVVDMPPGTGDVQLTMAQQVSLAGAIIVSTPQDLALIDARKGIAMFEKVNVPLIGVIENMSHFVCPVCGTHHAIFDHGGARAEAERRGMPFLGEVPLAMAIRADSDAGRPVVVGDPSGAHARTYRDIARQVLETLTRIQSDVRPAPQIVFE